MREVSLDKGEVPNVAKDRKRNEMVAATSVSTYSIPRAAFCCLIQAWSASLSFDS